jgi:hypothetical protein
MIGRGESNNQLSTHSLSLTWRWMNLTSIVDWHSWRYHIDYLTILWYDVMHMHKTELRKSVVYWDEEDCYTVNALFAFTSLTPCTRAIHLCFKILKWYVLLLLHQYPK